MSTIFSYINLLFNQTINIHTELQLKDAIFANSKLSKEKIYEHCRPNKSKCKNTYFLDCFITSRTDEYGNLMTYYISQSIIIVKCIKPIKPIPVLILFEITLPHNILFIIKVETKTEFNNLDILAFANDYLANPNMIFNLDLQKISDGLVLLSSDEEYKDFENMFLKQIELVRSNRKIMDHYVNITGNENEHNPYDDAHKILYDVKNLIYRMDLVLTRLTKEFNELNSMHTLLKLKYNIK